MRVGDDKNRLSAGAVKYKFEARDVTYKLGPRARARLGAGKNEYPKIQSLKKRDLP